MELGIGAQESGLSLDWNWEFVFFGIWIAEGWTDGNSTVIAANKHRVQKAYEKSCENMGFFIDKDSENDEDNIDWFFHQIAKQNLQKHSANYLVLDYYFLDFSKHTNLFQDYLLKMQIL